MSEKSNADKLAEVIGGMLGRLIFFALQCAFVMTCWNKGLATALELSEISYPQAVFITLLPMWLFDFPVPVKVQE